VAREVEPVGTLHSLVAAGRLGDPTDAVGARSAAVERNEVPPAGLQDEAERVDPPLGLAVAEVEPVARPDGLGDDGEQGGHVRGREPVGSVDVQALADASGPPGQLAGERRQDLGAGDRSGEEERAGLVEGDPVEAARPTVEETDAAARPAFRPDRDAGGLERGDVAVDGALGHLEPTSQGRRRRPLVVLEVEEEGDQPTCSHD
jgi:hypothetical protein